MYCVSLAILSHQSRFHPPAVGTNWPIQCWRAVKHQINKQIEPVNKQLQANALDVPAVTRMVTAVRGEVQIMWSDVVFKQIADESGIQLKDDSLAPAEDAGQGRDSNVAKRKRRPPTWLTRYTADQPGYWYAADSNMTSSAFRELYFAVLDKALAEFDQRFTERSMALIYAMTSLLNNNKMLMTCCH